MINRVSDISYNFLSYNKSKTRMSEEESFVKEMEKEGIQDFPIWAVRPKYFEGLQVEVLVPNPDISNTILNLSESAKIEHIRNNGFLQGFNCDGCGDSLGKALYCCDDNLSMIIYHPDGGFYVTDDGKRQDFCLTCAKSKDIVIFRAGITARDLFPDV